jgi:hypothetical protein
MTRTPNGGGTGEGEQLVARLDTAGAWVVVVALAAIGGPRRLVGVGFVDREGLVDTVGQSVQKRELRHPGLALRHHLDDVVAALEWVHRERANLVQGPSRIGVKAAVPGKAGLHGLLPETLAQLIELQFQPRAEHSASRAKSSRPIQRSRIAERRQQRMRRPKIWFLSFS